MAVVVQSVLTRRAGASARERSRFPLWVVPVMALCLLAIYTVGYDQGALLSMLLGDDSMKFNYIHEFVHDGRHLLAFACH